MSETEEPKEKGQQGLQHEHDYVSLTPEPLDVAALTWQAQDDGAGAISTFLGITRDTFEGRLVTSLEYEAYEPMAVAALQRICAQARSQWELKKVVVQHKLGACPVGHASVFIGVSSAHRRGAIAAAEFVIDTLKASVPIWKKENYAPSSSSSAATDTSVNASTDASTAAPAQAASADGSSSSSGGGGCSMRGGESSGNYAWKKNKEFQPRVPSAVLRAARAAPTAAPPAATARAAQPIAAEATASKLKAKMRQSVCDAAYVASSGGRLLLGRLDDLWAGDPLIDEVGFVMDASAGAALLCMEHKLGVPVGALKPLLAYCTSRLDSLCEEKLRRGDTSRSSSCSSGSCSSGSCGSGSAAYDDASTQAEQEHSLRADPSADVPPRLLAVKDLNMHLLSITRGVLVVRGDMPTALNMRKQVLLEMQSATAVDAELLLLQAISMQHPKSPSAWQHRRWAVRFRQRLRLPRRDTATVEEAAAAVTNEAVVADMWAAGDGDTLTSEQLATELKLCDTVSRRYKQNYYGWMHRLWTLQQGAASDDEAAAALLSSEMAYTHQWLLRNTSDHCAVNYFVQVVLATQRVLPVEQRWPLLLQQLPFSRGILRDRPGSEALWYLRRSLLQLVLRAFHARVMRSLSLHGQDQQQQQQTDPAVLAFTEARVGEAQLWHAVTAPAAADEREGEKEAAAPAAFLHFLLSTSLPGGDAEDTAYSALHGLLLSEMRFVQHCATDISVWNFQQQRTLSQRYALYCVTAGLSAVRSTMAMDLRPGAAGKGKGVQLLLSQLEAAAVGVRGRLAQEDSFERCWMSATAER